MNAKVILLVGLVAVLGLEMICAEKDILAVIKRDIAKLKSDSFLNSDRLIATANRRDDEYLVKYTVAKVIYQDVLSSMIKAAHIIATNPKLREEADAVYAQLLADGYSKGAARIHRAHKGDKDFQVPEVERDFLKKGAEVDKILHTFYENDASLLAMGEAETLARNL